MIAPITDPDGSVGALPPPDVAILTAAHAVGHPTSPDTARELADQLRRDGWRLGPEWAWRLSAESEQADSSDPAVQELVQWWLSLARTEADRTVPKAVEYGANDLVEIGRQMAQAAGGMGLSGDDAPPDAAERFAELGIYFYLVGKLARWTSAIQEGRRPSDDTLFDIGVYVRMAQRVRDTGSWPGVAPREGLDGGSDTDQRWISNADDTDDVPFVPVVDMPPDPPGMQVLGLEPPGNAGNRYWVLRERHSDRIHLGHYTRKIASPSGPDWYRIWPIDGSSNGGQDQ